MAGKKSDLGQTGINITHTVRRLREKQGLSYAELSRRLSEIGRDIPTLGLRRIESGTRRVDVDDLVALAAALGVSPATLLMPDAQEADEPVEATATPEGITAQQLWEWLTAKGGIGLEGKEQAVWLMNAAPFWALNITMGTVGVAVTASASASGEVTKAE